MPSTESILSKLSKIKSRLRLTEGNIRFYISVMDYQTGTMTSDFQSEKIDDVVSCLFDKSLTTSIMTIQTVGKNEVCIILKNESNCATNITDAVVESIVGFSK